MVDRDRRPASRDWSSATRRGGRADITTDRTAAGIAAPPTRRRTRASTAAAGAAPSVRAAQLKTSDIIPHAPAAAYSAGMPATTAAVALQRFGGGSTSWAPRLPSDRLTWQLGSRPWESSSSPPLPLPQGVLPTDHEPQEGEQLHWPQMRSARDGRRGHDAALP